MKSGFDVVQNLVGTGDNLSVWNGRGAGLAPNAIFPSVFLARKSINLSKTN